MAVPVAAIIAGVEAAARLTRAMSDLAAASEGVMTEADQVAVREAMAQLRASNDALHARLTVKLDRAAGK